MTVHDLVERLSKLNQDEEIVIPSIYYNYRGTVWKDLEDVQIEYDPELEGKVILYLK